MWSEQRSEQVHNNIESIFLYVIKKSKCCERWFHLCVFPPIEHKLEPIKMRLQFSLTYNVEYSTVPKSAQTLKLWLIMQLQHVVIKVGNIRLYNISSQKKLWWIDCSKLRINHTHFLKHLSRREDCCSIAYL